MAPQRRLRRRRCLTALSGLVRPRDACGRLSGPGVRSLVWPAGSRSLPWWPLSSEALVPGLRSFGQSRVCRRLARTRRRSRRPGATLDGPSVLRLAPAPSDGVASPPSEGDAPAASGAGGFSGSSEMSEVMRSQERAHCAARAEAVSHRAGGQGLLRSRRPGDD